MISRHSHRRDFLKSAATATLAALAANLPKPSTATANESPPAATADSLILLWMAGGMPHTETFDPKPYRPFEPGMKSESLNCTFPSIDTAVDGVRISAGLERIAAIMDRGTLVRSHVLADLGMILHSRHQYHWHTGYEPPVSVAAPHMGAWISHALGKKDSAVPAYIDIGQRYDGNGEAEELKSFQTAGFLGSEHGPFRIPDPSQALASALPPGDMTVSRFQSRYRHFKKLVAASPIGQPEVAISGSRCYVLWKTRIGLWSRRQQKHSTCQMNRPRAMIVTIRDVSASAACWLAGSSKRVLGPSK